MESSTRRASSTSQNSASGGGHRSPGSVGTDSSRSGTKPPYPVSFDLNSRLVIKNPEPPNDPPPAPMQSPVAISLRRLGKQIAGIKIPGRSSPKSERYDSSSESVSRFESSDDNWKWEGGQESPMIGTSPYLPSSAKLRSCDVYIGVPNSNPDMLSFAKWLRAELELQGVTCFAVDRSKCKDAVGHSVVERAMDSATFGVVVVSEKSFSNPYSMYELKSFLSRKNLVPIFFYLGPGDCTPMEIIGKRGELWERNGGELWKAYGGVEREWKEVVNALSRMDGWKLEARVDTWRDCISEAILLLGRKLGRRNVVERVERWMDNAKEEFPFPRNEKFVGRKKELIELELLLFGDLIDNANDCFDFQASYKRRNATAMRRIKSNSEVRKRYGGQTKGKEPAAWKESDDEIEMERSGILENHEQLVIGKNENCQIRRRPRRARYGKGIACVSGERGIGKTELVLEFAYRFAQRYRMVLWVGGEARYIRQNYMNLMSLLEIDVSIENQLCLERNRPRNFEELEGEAIRRLRKEFMRDIPFLLVIDNLENEKDWWYAKSIMELLPRLGGETHIVISTRLPHVMNLEPLKLSYLSAAESMSLMKGKIGDIPARELGALRVIEEKLGRLTFGLALVGGLLSEHPINPQGLLDAINQMPDRDLIGEEDSFFRRNPFLIRLIEVCFFIFGQVDELASRMALASGWFAPSPIPLSLLALASFEASDSHHKDSFWNKCRDVVTCRCRLFHKKKFKEDDSSVALVRSGFAKAVTKQGYIHFHEIIKLYARKKGGTKVAYAMVQAINAKGVFPEHSEHIWAACFLFFNFGADPAVLKPKAADFVSFIKRLAIPLAADTFTKFSRCSAALELLRLCNNALEDIDEPFLSEVDKVIKKSSCWGSSFKSTHEFNPRLYREFALLKATLLERRAELMLQGGDLDIAQQLCRKSISIREVLYGWDHAETVSACNTMGKLASSQANY